MSDLFGSVGSFSSNYAAYAGLNAVQGQKTPQETEEEKKLQEQQQDQIGTQQAPPPPELNGSRIMTSRDGDQVIISSQAAVYSQEQLQELNADKPDADTEEKELEVQGIGTGTTDPAQQQGVNGTQRGTEAAQQGAPTLGANASSQTEGDVRAERNPPPPPPPPPPRPPQSENEAEFQAYISATQQTQDTDATQQTNATENEDNADQGVAAVGAQQGQNQKPGQVNNLAGTPQNAANGPNGVGQQEEESKANTKDKSITNAELFKLTDNELKRMYKQGDISQAQYTIESSRRNEGKIAAISG